MPRTPESSPKWWQEAVVYQVYPLSFQDSNQDGFGDLRGIIDRLDYLAETLGVDAIWLSPFYQSPMRDWGYDVSDHTAVGHLFGDLDGARRLVEELDRRGMRLIVDLVINHTSDEHPWFEESRSSRDNPKRDWYVWRDGKEDQPPTNWVSVFSGPAWTLDETTGQWYRHTYLPSQPDLNWRNPEVVEAMFDVARFWLDLGVAGFRVDAAHQMMKDPRQRDNPPAPADYPRPWKDMGPYDEFVHLYDYGHPDVHDVHRELRAVVDSYDRDVLTVGEIHIFDMAEWASYYGEDLDQLTMPFNFHLMVSEWSAAAIRTAVESTLWHLPPGGWTNWTLGNHDEIRMASRLPEGQARLAGLLLLTLRGTPFLYYGDELGMPEVDLPPGEFRDPWGRSVAYLGRDGARTPMRWGPAQNAGFTGEGVVPWLPIGPGHESLNVEVQLEEPESLLNMYRRLLDLRRKSRPLRLGSLTSSHVSDEDVFAFVREDGGTQMTVAINFSPREKWIEVPAGRIVFSTARSDREEPIEARLGLGPAEGVIVEHA